MRHSAQHKDLFHASLIALTLSACAAGPQGCSGSQNGNPGVATAINGHNMAPFSATNATVTPALFGMHIHGADSTTPWPSSKFGAWRLWDSHTAWPWLEPARGTFTFDALDKDVLLAEQHGVQLLLPLGLSPTWASARPTEKSAYAPGNAAEPASMADWVNYVQAVATRYKGRIRHYEIWNEPNLKEFYTGSVDQLVELNNLAYQTLKGIDEGAVLISPSTTNGDTDYLDQFLTRGGHDDIIGYHFYTWTAPEDALPILAGVRAVMIRHGLASTPLWNTESGWNIDGGSAAPGAPIDQPTAANYIARAYPLFFGYGVARFYFYAWDDGQMGLVNPDLQPSNQAPTAAARAYDQTYQWLVGAELTGCVEDTDSTFVCTLRRPGGYQAHLVWNPARSKELSIPADWHATRARNLSGQTYSVENKTEMIIGNAPSLVEAGGESL